jgi:uncharacterized protein
MILIPAMFGEERVAVADLTNADVPPSTWKAIFDTHEVVRDPVHGDIRITELERRLIDTRAFQRLRTLKQLGPTEWVYPGAVHTRFSHSLGTLHLGQMLIDIANRNARTYAEPHMLLIGNYPTLLTRLTALLHDVAHLPFGHTLEDEGNILRPEWDDPTRVEKWLSDDSPLMKALAKYLKEFTGGASLIERLTTDIRVYLTTKRSDSMKLEFPFVIDLVNNTLCADLLDYSLRDSYFCGLRERVGDRFIQYVVVLNLRELPRAAGGKEEFDVVSVSAGTDGDSIARGRIVLLGYRMESGHRVGAEPRAVDKTSVLSEATDLLRLRYTLAEKVYFHRTKIIVSAMLISAVLAGDVSPQQLSEMGDEELLAKLAESKRPRARALVEHLRKRNLFKPLYWLSYRPHHDRNEDAIELWAVYERFRDPKTRLAAETRIESECGINQGSVCIYCPDKDMNLKRFEMLLHTRPGAPVKMFGDLLDKDLSDEIELLNRRYERLWKLQVFVDPEQVPAHQVLNTTTQAVNRLCESAAFFGMPNDNRHLRGSYGSDPVRDVFLAAAQRLIEEGVEVTVDKCLAAAAANGRRGASTPSEDEAMETLREFVRGEAKSSGG